MGCVTMHSIVGDDLILKLTLPEQFRNRAVKIVLESENESPANDEARDKNGWPIGFLERTHGAWVGPLERGPQGDFEVREQL